MLCLGDSLLSSALKVDITMIHHVAGDPFQTFFLSLLDQRWLCNLIQIWVSIPGLNMNGSVLSEQFMSKDDKLVEHLHRQ